MPNTQTHEPDTVDWTDDPLAWLTSHQLERCAAVAGVDRPTLSLREMPVELLRAVVEAAAYKQARGALRAAEAAMDGAEPRLMRADGVEALVDYTQRAVVASAVATGIAAARLDHVLELAGCAEFEAFPETASRELSFGLRIDALFKQGRAVIDAGRFDDAAQIAEALAALAAKSKLLGGVGRTRALPVLVGILTRQNRLARAGWGYGECSWAGDLLEYIDSVDVAALLGDRYDIDEPDWEQIEVAPKEARLAFISRVAYVATRAVADDDADRGLATDAEAGEYGYSADCPLDAAAVLVWHANSAIVSDLSEGEVAAAINAGAEAANADDAQSRDEAAAEDAHRAALGARDRYL